MSADYQIISGDYYAGPYDVGTMPVMADITVENKGTTQGNALFIELIGNPDTENEFYLGADESWELNPGEQRDLQVIAYNGIPEIEGYIEVGVRVFDTYSNIPPWTDTLKTHIWQIYIGTITMDLCQWINDQGGPTNLDITEVFTIIDHYIFQTQPTGYIFIPTIQNIMGIIDYYLGFISSGNNNTGCSF